MSLAAPQSRQRSDPSRNLIPSQADARSTAQTTAKMAAETAARTPSFPLATAELGRFEAAFGHRFDAVRVHVDPHSTARLGAEAFTWGQHITVAPALWQPGTEATRALLAHELAHVVQQRSGPGMGLLASNSAAEIEATRAERLVPVPSGTPFAPVVQTGLSVACRRGGGGGTADASALAYADEWDEVTERDPNGDEGSWQAFVESLSSDERDGVCGVLEERNASTLDDFEDQSADLSSPMEADAAERESQRDGVPEPPAAERRLGGRPQAPIPPIAREVPSARSRPATRVRTGGLSSPAASAPGPSGTRSSSRGGTTARVDELRTQTGRQVTQARASYAQQAAAIDTQLSRSAGEAAAASTTAVSAATGLSVGTLAQPTGTEEAFSPEAAFAAAQVSIAADAAAGGSGGAAVDWGAAREQAGGSAADLGAALGDSLAILSAERRRHSRTAAGSAAAAKRHATDRVDAVSTAFERSHTALTGSLFAAIRIEREETARDLQARQSTARMDTERTVMHADTLFADHRGHVNQAVLDAIQHCEDKRLAERDRVNGQYDLDEARAHQIGDEERERFGRETDRDWLQRSGVRWVEERVVYDMEDRRPEAMGAIDELFEKLPGQVRERGDSMLEGYDAGLPDIRNQFIAAGQAGLDELSRQAEEVTAGLDALEHSVGEELQAIYDGQMTRLLDLRAASVHSINEALASSQDSLRTHERAATRSIRPVGEHAMEVIRTEVEPDLAEVDDLVASMTSFFTEATDTASTAMSEDAERSSRGFWRMAQQTIVEAGHAETAGRTKLTDLETRGTDAINRTRTLRANSLEDIGDSLFSDLLDAEEDLAREFDDLIAQFHQPIDEGLRHMDANVDAAMEEGLAKNREALGSLREAMRDEAEDRGWAYDHPIRDFFRTVGKVLGVILLAIAALVAIFLAWELIVAVALYAGISEGAVMLIGGLLALVAVAGAYFKRRRRGQGVFRATLGSLGDITGITQIVDGFTHPYRKIEERAWDITFGLGTLLMTLTMFHKPSANRLAGSINRLVIERIPGLLGRVGMPTFARGARGLGEFAANPGRFGNVWRNNRIPNRFANWVRGRFNLQEIPLRDPVIPTGGVRVPVVPEGLEGATAPAELVPQPTGQGAQGSDLPVAQPVEVPRLEPSTLPAEPVAPQPRVATPAQPSAPASSEGDARVIDLGSYRRQHPSEPIEPTGRDADIIDLHSRRPPRPTDPPPEPPRPPDPAAPAAAPPESPPLRDSNVIDLGARRAQRVPPERVAAEERVPHSQEIPVETIPQELDLAAGAENMSGRPRASASSGDRPPGGRGRPSRPTEPVVPRPAESGGGAGSRRTGGSRGNEPPTATVDPVVDPDPATQRAGSRATTRETQPPSAPGLDTGAGATERPPELRSTLRDDLYAVEDPRSGPPRLQAVGRLENEELSLTIRTQTPAGQRHPLLRGAEQFTRIMGHFAGRVKTILGSWHYESNLRAFNEALLRLRGSSEIITEDMLQAAARETWTGQQAAGYGYTEVEIRNLEGTPGSYTQVKIAFTRPAGGPAPGTGGGGAGAGTGGRGSLPRLPAPDPLPRAVDVPEPASPRFNPPESPAGTGKAPSTLRTSRPGESPLPQGPARSPAVGSGGGDRTPPREPWTSGLGEEIEGELGRRATAFGDGDLQGGGGPDAHDLSLNVREQMNGMGAQQGGEQETFRTSARAADPESALGGRQDAHHLIERRGGDLFMDVLREIAERSGLRFGTAPENSVMLPTLPPEQGAINTAATRHTTVHTSRYMRNLLRAVLEDLPGSAEFTITEILEFDAAMRQTVRTALQGETNPARIELLESTLRGPLTRGKLERAGIWPEGQSLMDHFGINTSDVDLPDVLQSVGDLLRTGRFDH